jgi:hypothetical protein
MRYSEITSQVVVKSMLPEYKPQRKKGDERIIIDGAATGPTVTEFWQWSCSNLLGNAFRGIFAEYLVANALNMTRDIRQEWDAVDLRLENGIRIEVKSAAYLQSWTQKNLSKITFGIRKTKGWDADTNETSLEKCRQSDLYVFCLLAHQDKQSVDPLDMSQWEFFVIRTSDLNSQLSSQQTISLKQLKKLPVQACSYSQLASTIGSASTFRERKMKMEG